MNCPDCGRFMKLECAFEWPDSILNGDKSAFWWICINENCLSAWSDKFHPIPAPEYDWLYYWEGIPESDLEFEDDPELWKEYQSMKQAYIKRSAALRQHTGAIAR